MGDLSDFERGQNVGATLLGVWRERDSKVMSAYTNHGKTTSAKINIDRKRRRTLRIVSKNHTTTAAQVDRTTELNIHLEDSVSTKTVRR
jgi:hypothetical protein